ncbi:hypothetical protein M758_UG166200 [Ceratodon purpureus]|nr:hypothetical protein M758_UG166200 [Ceratodon purpureus]
MLGLLPSLATEIAVPVWGDLVKTGSDVVPIRVIRSTSSGLVSRSALYCVCSVGVLGVFYRCIVLDQRLLRGWGFRYRSGHFQGDLRKSNGVRPSHFA